MTEALLERPVQGVTASVCMMNDECVFIYRTYHIMSYGGLQLYFE